MKTPVSIGIPIYNESSNILPLIISILSQHESFFEIIEILIISDGSTDESCTKIKKLNHPIVRLIEYNERKGQPFRQNELFSQAKGKILVLLEGDTLPCDEHFVSRLVAPLVFDCNNSIGMTYGTARTLPARTYFERIMNFAWQFKLDMVQTLSGAHNFYLFRGQSGRAFSRTMLEKLRFVEDAPEDTYSYLFCLSEGFDVIYCPDANIYFRSVAHFADALRQNNKYLSSLTALRSYFPKEILQSRYHVPTKQFLFHFFRYILFHPILMMCYLWIFFVTRLLANRQPFSPFTEIYQSSKDLAHIKIQPSTAQGRATQEHFNLVSSRYIRDAFLNSEGLKKIHEEERKLLLDAFKKLPTQSTILDMGIGAGRNAEFLLENKYRVTGIDFAQSMIVTTSERLSYWINEKQLTLQQHDLHDPLRLESESYQGAMCIRVIKYITNWRDVLSEAARILKKDGVFVIDIANTYSVQFFSQYFDTYRTFTERNFSYELKKAGFKIEKVIYGPVLPFVLFKLARTVWIAERFVGLDRSLRRIFGQYGSKTIFFVCKKA